MRGITVVNFVSSAVLAGIILKKREVQNYNFNLIDFLMLLVLGVTVYCAGLYQFDDSIKLFNYETGDAGTHLMNAFKYYDTKKVTGMYFVNALDGIIFESFENVIPRYYFNKIFILVDLLLLYFSGISFWMLIREKMINFSLQIIGVLVTLAYILGYPLNNMVFGFEYLGVGIITITFIIYFYKLYVDNVLSPNSARFILLLLLYSLGISYVLFIPPIYCGLFIYSFVYSKKGKWSFTKEDIKLLVEVYIIPVIIISYHVYVNWLKTVVQIGMSSGETAWGSEGYIHRTLVSDFIFLLPFAIFYLYKKIKKKEIEIDIILSICYLGYMILFFVLKTLGIFSEYYYCKNNYIFWMLCFYLLFCGISAVENNKKWVYIYLSTAVIWIICFCCSMPGIIFNSGIENVVTNMSLKLFPVYSFNYSKAGNSDPSVNEDEMQLFYKAAEMEATIGEIPYLGDDNQYLPYYAVLGKTERTYYYQAMDTTKTNEFAPFWEYAKEKGAQYVTIGYYGHQYKKNADFFNSMEKIYECEAGFIGKIP